MAKNKNIRRSQTETLKAQKRCLKNFINEMQYFTAERTRVEAELKSDKSRIDTKEVKRLKTSLSKLHKKSLSHSTRLMGGMAYEITIPLEKGDKNESGETWDGKGFKVDVIIHNLPIAGSISYNDLRKGMSFIGITVAEACIGCESSRDKEEKAKEKKSCKEACGTMPDPGEIEEHAAWVNCQSACD